MNLTPEQMNEARNIAMRWYEGCDYDDGLESVKPEVDQLVRRLFAAWQEQTAAKAGDNPHRKHAAELLALPCQMPAAAEHEEMLARIYDEGAAAGVAASEERVRRAEETRENANQASVRVELENRRLKERLALDRQAREIVEALREMEAVARGYSIECAEELSVAADSIERRFAPKEADPR